MADFFRNFIGSILIAGFAGLGYLWICVNVFNLPSDAAQFIAASVGFSIFVKLMLSPFPLAMIEWFEDRLLRSLDQ